MDEDGKTRREAMIDPRQGFSLLMTDKIDSKIGVKYNNEYSAFFGVDGQGRLLSADHFFSKFDFRETIVKGVSITNLHFINNSLAPISIFGYLENRCMTSGNSLPCGHIKYPPEAEDWWQLKSNKMDEMIASGNIKPDFGLVRP
jgi:hypothetical protein